MDNFLTETEFYEQLEDIARKAEKLAEKCRDYDNHHAPNEDSDSQIVEVYRHDSPLGEEACQLDDLANECLNTSFNSFREDPADQDEDSAERENEARENFIQEKSEEFEELKDTVTSEFSSNRNANSWREDHDFPEDE